MSLSLGREEDSPTSLTDYVEDKNMSIWVMTEIRSVSERRTTKMSFILLIFLWHRLNELLFIVVPKLDDGTSFKLSVKVQIMQNIHSDILQNIDPDNYCVKISYNYILTSAILGKFSNFTFKLWYYPHLWLYLQSCNVSKFIVYYIMCFSEHVNRKQSFRCVIW